MQRVTLVAMRRVLTLALVIGAAAVLWRFVRREPGSGASAARPGELGGVREPASTLVHSATTLEGVRDDRRELEASRELSDARETAATLRGRVVDAWGSALAGAHVELSYRASDEFVSFDASSDARALAETDTDSQGRFEFSVQPGRAHRLTASAAGYASVVRGGCRAGEVVEIELAAGATLFGSVARAADGSSVGGARIELRPRSTEGGPRVFGRRHSTTTDAFGSYHLESVAPGPWGLRVVPAADAPVTYVELDLASGQRLRRDVLVAAGRTVRGRVIDAASALPIAGAEVGEGWSFHRTVRTDVDGRYEFRGYAREFGPVHARAPGYGVSAADVDFDSAEPTADFALARGRGVRVVDPSGAAVVGASVAAVARDQERPSPHSRLDWRATQTDAEGRYHLVELCPDMRHALVVRSEGFGLVEYDFPADESARPDIELPDVVLARGGAIEGRVVDEFGTGYSNLEVELGGANPLRARWCSGEDFDRGMLDLYVAQRPTLTDRSGRFWFLGVAAGDYTVSALRPTSHESVQVRVTVASAQAATGVTLLLGRGFEIGGRVTVSAAGPIPKVYVSVDSEAAGRSADVECARDVRSVQPGSPTRPTSRRRIPTRPPKTAPSAGTFAARGSNTSPRVARSARSSCRSCGAWPQSSSTMLADSPRARR